MKPFLLLIFIFIFCLYQGQSSNIVNPEKIENPIQKKYSGKIVFLNKNIPLENLKDSDIITSSVFQENGNLGFMHFLKIRFLTIFTSLPLPGQLMNYLKTEITSFHSMLTKN